VRASPSIAVPDEFNDSANRVGLMSEPRHKVIACLQHELGHEQTLGTDADTCGPASPAYGGHPPGYLAISEAAADLQPPTR
jgi:hypothetical protein